jgi:hypothetical protein
MTDAQNQHHQPIMFERTDETIVSDTIFPELAERAFESLADFARVVEFGDALVKELRDTTSNRFI